MDEWTWDRVDQRFDQMAQSYPGFAEHMRAMKELASGLRHHHVLGRLLPVVSHFTLVLGSWDEPRLAVCWNENGRYDVWYDDDTVESPMESQRTQVSADTVVATLREYWDRRPWRTTA